MSAPWLDLLHVKYTSFYYATDMNGAFMSCEILNRFYEALSICLCVLCAKQIHNEDKILSAPCVIWCWWQSDDGSVINL